MNDICTTVVIVTDNGPVTINESDYDPKVHTLAVDDQTAQPSAVVTGEVLPPVVEGGESAMTGHDADGLPIVETPVVVADAAPMILLVLKNGRKYFIVDMTGKPVVGDGIDTTGYPTEEAALTVITGLTDEQKATIKTAE